MVRRIIIQTKDGKKVNAVTLINTKMYYTWFKCDDGNVYTVNTYDYEQQLNKELSILHAVDVAESAIHKINKFLNESAADSVNELLVCLRKALTLAKDLPSGTVKDATVKDLRAIQDKIMDEFIK